VANRCVGTAVALSFALGGCTVPIDGVAGITLDRSGRPVAVLDSCKHDLDGASLDLTEGGGGEKDVGTWSMTTSTQTPVQWPLVSTGAPSGSVAVQDDPSDLDRRATYSLYGWTKDHSYSAVDVTFRLADLAGLRPGEVLVYGDAAEGGTTGHRVVTLAELERLACRG